MKQETAKLLLKPKGGEYKDQLSDKHTVKLFVNSDRTSYKISILKKDKAKPSTSLDSAFDKLNSTVLLSLLKDFVTEVFLYSNFSVFNDEAALLIDQHTDKQNQTNITIVYVEVKNKEGYNLKSVQRHLDNPQGKN